MKDILAFKRDHDLATDSTNDDLSGRIDEEEVDLRAEDDALIAAELDAAAERAEDEDEEGDEEGEDGDKLERPARRRGRRGGRGRRMRAKAGPLEGSFDHGDEGYGLWLDPGIQDDPLYAEHWAGHRPVTVTVEADRIVIRRAGESTDDPGSAGDPGFGAPADDPLEGPDPDDFDV